MERARCCHASAAAQRKRKPLWQQQQQRTHSSSEATKPLCWLLCANQAYCRGRHGSMSLHGVWQQKVRGMVPTGATNGAASDTATGHTPRGVNGHKQRPGSPHTHHTPMAACCRPGREAATCTAGGRAKLTGGSAGRTCVSCTQPCKQRPRPDPDSLHHNRRAQYTETASRLQALGRQTAGKQRQGVTLCPAGTHC
jgi:hypothetical protein